MPTRRKQAYSFLEKALKLAGGDAAAGSTLGNYKAFKAGTRKKNSSENTALTPQQRTRDSIALAPFNKVNPTTAAGRYNATITRFSSAQKTNLGISDLELGYTGITGTTASSDFFPAMLTASVNNGDKKPKISGITGKSYSFQPSRTYSFPFGRTTATGATDTEDGRRLFLATEMKKTTQTTPAKSVGYQPEVWRYEPGSAAGELAGVPAPT